MVLSGQFTLKTVTMPDGEKDPKDTGFALARKTPQTLGAFATVPCDRPSPVRAWWIIIQTIWTHAHDLTKMCTSKTRLFSSQKGNKIFHKRPKPCSCASDWIR